MVDCFEQSIPGETVVKEEYYPFSANILSYTLHIDRFMLTHACINRALTRCVTFGLGISNIALSQIVLSFLFVLVLPIIYMLGAHSHGVTLLRFSL